MTRTHIVFLSFCILAGVGILVGRTFFFRSDTPSMKSETMTPPAQTIDTSKTYTAVLHTQQGDITIALDAKNAPVTVNNFVTLSRSKFYDGTAFHRVIDGFMIQGGDPKGDGTGGPGYTFADEHIGGNYVRGTVAMANRGPNTNGSQFFIMQQTVGIDKLYSIFGTVTDGMDVVDNIAKSPVHGLEGSTPDQPVVVSSITIKEE